MAKLVSGKTRQRIVIPDYRMEKIIGWDADNAYPQRVIDLVLASGTASSCVRTYKRFIKGQGFEQPELQSRYAKLLENVANDKAMLGTFAIHVQYNELLDIVALTHVPVEYCRIGTDGMIAVYNNWDKRSLRENYKVTDIKRFYPYNPAKVAEEIADLHKGDIVDYPGQILWVKPDDKEYPLAPCDSVLQDIRTDAGVQQFKNKNIRTNFMASHMYVHRGKFESDQERMEFRDYLNEFQGSESAGNIMLIEASMDEALPELKPFTIQNNDKLWEYTESSIKNNIVSSFSIPPVLAGILQAGKLGTSSEIADATVFYNDFCADDRLEIEQTFTLLTGVQATIRPIQDPYAEPENGEDSLQQISLNGAQISSLLEIIANKNSGVISEEAAIEIITSSFPSITLEAAQKMLQ